MSSGSMLPPMINHWWWRPGWSVGRRFYTWHLTFENVTEVRRLVEAYDTHLGLPGLDVIPERWLHLTMQGIGFVHEVDEADVRKIVTAAQQRLAKLEPFHITLGPAVVDPEVVRLRVTPPEPVAELRLQLRAAIAVDWGTTQVPDAEDDFTPHVSLAYSNRPGDMAPILAAAEHVSTTACLTVRHADLILLNRDEQEYRWETYAAVPLGG